MWLLSRPSQQKFTGFPLQAPNDSNVQSAKLGGRRWTRPAYFPASSNERILLGARYSTILEALHSANVEEPRLCLAARRRFGVDSRDDVLLFGFGVTCAAVCRLFPALQLGGQVWNKLQREAGHGSVNVRPGAVARKIGAASAACQGGCQPVIDRSPVLLLHY